MTNAARRWKGGGGLETGLPYGGRGDPVAQFPEGLGSNPERGGVPTPQTNLAPPSF